MNVDVTFSYCCFGTFLFLFYFCLFVTILFSYVGSFYIFYDLYIWLVLHLFVLLILCYFKLLSFFVCGHQDDYLMEANGDQNKE